MRELSLVQTDRRTPADLTPTPFNVLFTALTDLYAVIYILPSFLPSFREDSLPAQPKPTHGRPMSSKIRRKVHRRKSVAFN